MPPERPGEVWMTAKRTIPTCTLHRLHRLSQGQSVIDAFRWIRIRRMRSWCSIRPPTGQGCALPPESRRTRRAAALRLAGYDTCCTKRSIPENTAALEEMQTYHATVATRPAATATSPTELSRGGLLEGTFVRTRDEPHLHRLPRQPRQEWYYGLNEGYPGDVHLRQGRLACTDCHTSAELHGQDGLSEVVHRYEGAQAPTCESCHEDQIGPDSGIPEHDIHGKDLLSCQTCHSVAYTNCTNCHVDRSEDDVPFYTIESHDVGFFIGRNPTRNNERPYRYVPVRHVPVDPNSFERYGEDLLVNFLNRPTWAYATPHNIQRETPQNASCTCATTTTPSSDARQGGRIGARRGEPERERRARARLPGGYEQYLRKKRHRRGRGAPSGTRASGRTRPRAPRRTMAASGPTTPRLRRRAIAPPISGASLRPRPARIAPRTFGGSERDRLLAAPPDGMVQREPAPASPGRTRASINCRRTIVRNIGGGPPTCYA